MAPADWLRPLQAHAMRLSGTPIRRLNADDATRATDFSLRVGPPYANFCRQRYDREALSVLDALAGERRLPSAMRALFDGDRVNASEDRPALHTARG